MPLEGFRAGLPGRARRVGRGVRSHALVVALVLGAGAVLSTACAPPTSSSSSTDGGVSVTPPAGATAAAAPVDVALTDTKGLDGPMAVTPFADSAPAGDVTFNVKNLGTIEHELIVLKTDIAFDQLPVADAGDPPAPVTSGADKVDEAANVGETGDPNLKPGDTRSFTIKGLAPGKYALVCNLAKHYGLGMRAPFTVSPPKAAGPVAVTLSDTKGLNGPMAITSAAASAPAGDVTFNVKNAGTIEHELVVLKTDVAFDQLPVADAGDPPAPVTSGADKVDEAANVGETGDPNLKPGDTRSFTIKGLAPGKYVLVCNLAKHYGLGMRAPFTVT